MHSILTQRIDGHGNKKQYNDSKIKICLMGKFLCKICGNEIKSLHHKCGEKDNMSFEIMNGGSWGNINLP
jgi:hypothetical protein